MMPIGTLFVGSVLGQGFVPGHWLTSLAIVGGVIILGSFVATRIVRFWIQA